MPLSSPGPASPANNPALAAASLPSLRSLSWLRVRNNASLSELELGAPQNLRIVEVSANANLATLNLGAPTNLLERLELYDNPGLASEAQQLLSSLIGEQTSLTLD